MKVEIRDINGISLAKYNPRRITKDAHASLIASIKRFGFVDPVIVNDRTGVLVGGHQRIKAAKELNLVQIPVVCVDLDEADEKALNVALNKISGEWDMDALRSVLTDVTRSGIDATVMGFTEQEINSIIGDENEIDLGLTDADHVPDATEEIITNPGDIWILGNHRLMCGDATNKDHVHRLMNGNKSDICFTSPPYALGKSVSLSGNKSMSKKGNAYDHHQDDHESWMKLMREWYAASFVAVSDVWVINVQPLAGNKRNLIKFIEENSSKLIDIATWDKGHAAPAMASGVMSSVFEWLIFFSIKDHASRSVPMSSWRGTIKNVYSESGQKNNEFSKKHAATMPTHLPTWIMRDVCDKSSSVYEPFCGTGTTIIVAEQLKKKCYAMEISPSYCDISVKRWEQFTGKKAIRL